MVRRRDLGWAVLAVFYGWVPGHKAVCVSRETGGGEGAAGRHLAVAGAWSESASSALGGARVFEVSGWASPRSERGLR